jgi:signal transduction histidine kinase
MDWRRHITLIFKEAMNNVLKHSRGQNATLRVKLERNYLVITLEDDGKGLPESLISESQHGSIEIDSPGNGLNNMQFRAQKILGRINFLSNGSNGTIVKFSGEIPHIGN